MDQGMFSMYPSGIRVLLVDDDPRFLKTASTLLTLLNFKVTTCGSPSSALKVLSDVGKFKDIDVVIADAANESTCGFDFKAIVEPDLTLPVLYFLSQDYKCAGPEADALLRTLDMASYILTKPIEVDPVVNLWRDVAWRKCCLIKESRGAAAAGYGGQGSSTGAYVTQGSGGGDAGQSSSSSSVSYVGQGSSSGGGYVVHGSSGAGYVGQGSGGDAGQGCSGAGTGLPWVGSSYPLFGHHVADEERVHFREVRGVRGRKRKNVTEDGGGPSSGSPSDPAAAAPAPTPVRRRGRPPKNQQVVHTNVAGQGTDNVPNKPRRGRPKKVRTGECASLPVIPEDMAVDQYQPPQPKPSRFVQSVLHTLDVPPYNASIFANAVQPGTNIIDFAGAGNATAMPPAPPSPVHQAPPPVQQAPRAHAPPPSAQVPQATPTPPPVHQAPQAPAPLPSTQVPQATPAPPPMHQTQRAPAQPPSTQVPHAAPAPPTVHQAPRAPAPPPSAQVPQATLVQQAPRAPAPPPSIEAPQATPAAPPPVREQAPRSPAPPLVHHQAPRAPALQAKHQQARMAPTPPAPVHYQASMVPAWAPVHHQVAPPVPARAPVHHQVAPTVPARAPVHHQVAPPVPARALVHHQVAPPVPARPPVHHQVAPQVPARAPVHYQAPQLAPAPAAVYGAPALPAAAHHHHQQAAAPLAAGTAMPTSISNGVAAAFPHMMSRGAFGPFPYQRPPQQPPAAMQQIMFSPHNYPTWNNNNIHYPFQQSSQTSTIATGTYVGSGASTGATANAAHAGGGYGNVASTYVQSLQIGGAGAQQDEADGVVADMIASMYDPTVAFATVSRGEADDDVASTGAFHGHTTEAFMEPAANVAEDQQQLSMADAAPAGMFGPEEDYSFPLEVLLGIDFGLHEVEDGLASQQQQQGGAAAGATATGVDAAAAAVHLTNGGGASIEQNWGVELHGDDSVAMYEDMIMNFGGDELFPNYMDI